MRVLDRAGNGADGADTGAGGAALALVGDDLIMKQGFADAGRAFLIHDMRDVLVPEEFEGGEYGIRSGLAQSAKGIRLDIMAQLLQLVDILQRAVALGDLVEASRADAWCPPGRGVNLQQDSSTVNSRKNLAISTMQVSSSMTIRPPEPIMQPMAIRLS